MYNSIEQKISKGNASQGIYLIFIMFIIKYIFLKWLAFLPLKKSPRTLLTNSAALPAPADDSDVRVDGKLVIVGLKSWGGMSTRGSLRPLKLPVPRVIISDTPPDVCETRVSPYNYPFKDPSRILQLYRHPVPTGPE